MGEKASREITQIKCWGIWPVDYNHSWLWTQIELLQSSAHYFFLPNFPSFTLLHSTPSSSICQLNPQLYYTADESHYAGWKLLFLFLFSSLSMLWQSPELSRVSAAPFSPVYPCVLMWCHLYYVCIHSPYFHWEESPWMSQLIFHMLFYMFILSGDYFFSKSYPFL